MDITAIFCDIDDFVKTMQTQKNSQLFSFSKAKRRGGGLTHPVSRQRYSVI